MPEKNSDEKPKPEIVWNGLNYVSAEASTWMTALLSWPVLNEHIPFIFDKLPVLVAARTDISPVDKLVYADRLNFMFLPPKADEPKKDPISRYVSYNRLASRNKLSRRQMIACINRLEAAKLMDKTTSTASGKSSGSYVVSGWPV